MGYIPYIPYINKLTQGLETRKLWKLWIKQSFPHYNDDFTAFQYQTNFMPFWLLKNMDNSKNLPLSAGSPSIPLHLLLQEDWVRLDLSWAQ